MSAGLAGKASMLSNQCALYHVGSPGICRTINEGIKQICILWEKTAGLHLKNKW